VPAQGKPSTGFTYTPPLGDSHVIGYDGPYTVSAPPARTPYVLVRFELVTDGVRLAGGIAEGTQTRSANRRK